MDENIKLLKKSSIRARFAMGIICMKRAFREKNIHQTYEAYIISKKISQPLISDDFCIWDEELKAYILSDEFENAEEIICFLIDLKENRTKQLSFEIFDEDVYSSLIEFYKSIDEELKELIYQCSSIVANHLYCGYCEKDSIDPLLDLLNKTEMWSKFDFFQIAKNYPFHQDDEWGEKFEFDSFKRR